MPKFIYTFIFGFLISSLILARTVFLTSPEERLSLFVFFVSLFFSALGLFSTLASLFFLPRNREIIIQKAVFKKIFHYSLSAALLIVTVALLKVLGALNPLNLTLLLLVAIVYEGLARQ